MRPDIAGWSSLVARRAHNPEVVGSNPAPATKNLQLVGYAGELFCCFPTMSRLFSDFILGMPVAGAAPIGVGTMRRDRRKRSVVAGVDWVRPEITLRLTMAFFRLKDGEGGFS